jgi:uncharacterized protein YfeS
MKREDKTLIQVNRIYSTDSNNKSIRDVLLDSMKREIKLSKIYNTDVNNSDVKLE